MAEPLPPVESLLPHRGPMRLLDDLLEVGVDHVRCRAVVRADNPFVRDGVLDPVAHVEVIAQAAAAFITASDPLRRAIRGYLVATRNVELADGDLPVGAVLEVSVREAARVGDFASFDGVVTCDGREVARGNVKVFKAGEVEA